ncbi:outer membrane protein OmpA-like peptidoglycan-associated protein [Roseivirga pacifica]|uniref:Outer membrane protein OmpA n=1 Tax=Roseivirga pacifica TaxID=1267423 RepID=A0A1I0RBH6_9BACT|nr:OmpA family protein [Roseivirga pacifica]RKQ49344.1 outer membrane protein OmpA-like peptidoglycan-associated protein [Roseivirga pacifica]SEW38153.1 Outer membrane protein OmpA [Roseivirga pacifica]
MKKLLLITALMIAGLSTYGQTADDPWWVNIEYANNKFEYRYYEGLFNFLELDNSAFRVGVDRYLGKSFDLEAGFSYGKLIHEDIFEANLTDLDLRLVYKLANGYILKEESVFAPFIFAGAGVNWYGNVQGFYEEFEEGTYVSLPLGLGFDVKVTEKASITFKAAYKKNIQDAPDYMQYSLGVSFSLQRKKDSDGDGIYDKEDACPNEAGPAENKGCPWPDSDNDGVLDKDDECPNDAGTLNGCPDSDGDGIKDSEDSCPNVAGVAQFGGCPDQDGDGVQDSEDACPTVAGTLNGCPDSDGDGVRDQDDECPNAAGGLNGCPDADGDGIKDSEDACPNEAGIAANRGCPEVKEEIREVLTTAVKEIQFNSSSDVLRSSSFASLDNLVKIMNDNPSYKLLLSGYTDNTGPAAFNLELSKKRAAAVEKYLEDKGIAADRIRSQGFGEEDPIADNGTAAGRAKNRRVHIDIEF